MPFSHHSHSGQFCNHAAGSLEEMVQQAIKLGMSTFALTEHIPRDAEDLYPEEESVESLVRAFDAFYPEAMRLRRVYASQIKILIGFEGEWIRPTSLDIIQKLLNTYKFDLFVGSVHHVHTKPIDYDHELYYEAREIAGGTDEKLFESYYDSQYEMLKALTPPVIGHFDLIRLKSDDPERCWTSMPAVWSKIIRNLEFIASYGGIVELNSSAIRKGMNEPYPKQEICQAFLEMKGRFTFSDDSHATDQVGLNFGKVLDFAQRAGIEEFYCIRGALDNDFRAAAATADKIPIREIKTHRFWKAQS